MFSIKNEKPTEYGEKKSAIKCQEESSELQLGLYF